MKIFQVLEASALVPKLYKQSLSCWAVFLLARIKYGHEDVLAFVCVKRK